VILATVAILRGGGGGGGGGERDARELAREQAALRRVAELVAQEASTTEIFDAVVSEAASVLEIEAVGLMRLGPDATATVVALSQTPFATAPVGTRFSLDGENAIAQIARTGKAVRVDDWATATGTVAAEAMNRGVRSTVGTPIVAQGRVWGALLASTSSAEPLPVATESRIAKFAGLISTAISNAESRDALVRLAEEQASLRRVATLVAAGVPPTVIFTAVSREIEQAFRLAESSTDRVTVIRFDPGPTAVIVGAAKDDPEEPIGTAWEPKPLYVSTKVLATERSARIETPDPERDGGPDAEALRARGIISQVGSPIVVRRRLWGALTLNTREGLPPDTEERLEKFTELVATAVANAEAQSELAASRRRIVSASDEARRRIERDLHDGTQQRLVSLGLALREVEAMVPEDLPELRVELSDITASLSAALEDLQELSRGIHPAVLSSGGLVPALRTLARRSAIPVDLELPGSVELPESVEVAAYFVTSEALANAAKHARASRVDVSLRLSGRTLALAIRDDGVGGADVSSGSGLVGLTDRVEALGGSVVVDSPPGEGTTITARLPT
jgi:signal transduction histidine kinase